MKNWVILILVGILFSCSVEKRMYLPGYSIEWKKKARVMKNNPVSDKIEDQIATKSANEIEETILLEPEVLTVFEVESITDTIAKDHHEVGKLNHTHLPLHCQLFSKEHMNRFKVLEDEPEEEETSISGFATFLAIFLGIIVGVLASFFSILLLVLGDDVAGFAMQKQKYIKPGSFRSVYSASFVLTFKIMCVLLVLSLLVLLSIYVYQVYGLWQLLTVILGVVLAIVLVTLLLDGVMNIAFHDR